MATVILSDTTLRDGVQMPGARIGIPGAVRIARALQDAGVRSIEAGFPAAGDAEVERIRAVAASARCSMIMGLSRTRRDDIDAVRTAFDGVPRMRCGVNLFIGTSRVHRERRLKKTRSEIIAMVGSSVAYARRFFRFVSLSAEDATRTEPAFLNEVYQAAVDAGATTIGFPDTLGVLLPADVERAVEGLCARFGREGVRIAVHFHNDLGLATANTLAALAAGAEVAQCTVNGIGERAGNAALEEVVTALALHGARIGKTTNVDPVHLTALSRLVVEETGVRPATHKAVVGENIFKTEAGLHQDGLLKDPATYLPFPPELVGADALRLSLGRLSGRSAVAAYLTASGRDASPHAVSAVLDAMKTRTDAEPPIEMVMSTSGSL